MEPADRADEREIEKIENGESTVEKEFGEGIPFEDGKYGLKYQGKMIKREGVWHTEKIR